MKVSVKFYEILFSDKVSKQAYLKACKWLAKHVISKVEVGETTFSIKKLPVKNKTDLPTFKVELYCSLEESNIQKSFCDACKQMHRSFFINEEYNCNSCKMRAYIEQIKHKTTIQKGYRKERLDYVMKG